MLSSTRAQGVRLAFVQQKEGGVSHSQLSAAVQRQREESLLPPDSQLGIYSIHLMSFSLAACSWSDKVKVDTIIAPTLPVCVLDSSCLAHSQASTHLDHLI